MISRSRNPFLTFLLGYYVWLTSKIQVNFRFTRYWWFCLINFRNLFTIHVLRSRNTLLIFLPGHPIWVTSKIQVNFRLKRFTEVLMIASYGFLECLQYMISRSGNHLLTFLLSYYACGTSKIQNNLRFWNFSKSTIESSSYTEVSK